MTFGERLKELRGKRDWTQAQLSEKLEVGVQVISNYERDYRQPDYEGLIKLSELFNVTIDYLIKGDGSVKVETFGSRIKSLRIKQNLNQEDISNKIGVSRVTLTHYESNYREPSFETLIKLASLFKVTTDYLLGYEVEK